MNRLIWRWAIVSLASAIISIAGNTSKVIADTSTSSNADYTFLVTPDWRNCSQISTDYQEVFAFETLNFHINICQKDDLYFYSGETKQSNRSSIFIPAYPLENGQGFQANNGNLTYLVLVPFANPTSSKSDALKRTEAILTIKRNGQLVSVESSLNKYCDQSEIAIIPDGMELESQNSNQVAIVPIQQDLGFDISSLNSNDRLLSPEIFHSNSQFDFYRVDNELRLLATCN